MSNARQFARALDSAIPSRTNDGDAPTRSPSQRASHNNTTNTPREDQLPTNVITAIESIIDRFKSRQLSKPRASKELALRQYLTTLDSFEQLASESHNRGINQPLPNPASELSNTRPTDTSHTSEDLETAVFMRSIVARPGDKRKHDQNEPDDDDARGQVDDSDDDPNKRARIVEKDMPWYRRESEARVNANPSCTKTHKVLHMASHQANGNTSSRASPSTSTPSTAHSTMLLQSRRTLAAWDRLRSLWDAQNHPDELQPAAIGPLHGTQPLKHTSSCSRTGKTNYGPKDHLI